MLRGNSPMLEGPIAMTIYAYPPDRRRRDCDNLLKCMLDSLQHAQIYHDDSQIKELHFYMLEPYRNGGKMIISLQEKEGETEV